MSSAKEKTRFRVGDWVRFQYGARKAVAQVIEDRGPLGQHGQRLYRLRLAGDGDRATRFEMPEEELEAAPAPGQMERSIHRTISYFGDEYDEQGMPTPWFHYLVVASSGPKPGMGIASILSLSEARATGTAQSPSHAVIAQTGGPESALKQAEEYLDAQHPSLTKAVSEVK